MGIKSTFCFYRVREHYGFGFIQESLITDETVFKSLASLWRGPMFWSPATGKQGGLILAF